MKVVGLFSGAGGLDYGFKKAGAEIIWANEINDVFCKTYELNLGEEIICSDIREINPNIIPDSDLIIGGFPCLGFTIAIRSPSFSSISHSIISPSSSLRKLTIAFGTVALKDSLLGDAFVRVDFSLIQIAHI